jgi:peroxiredoxin
MKLNIALLTLFCASAVALAEVQTGKPAPDFEGKGIDGKTYKLSDYKGKIVVLESMNPDCPYVANHYNTGAMPELQSDAVRKGVVWLTVSSVNQKSSGYRDAKAAQQTMQQLKAQPTGWIDDSDGRIGKAFGMKTTPHLFVIDKEGNVAYQGAIDDKPATEGDPRKARNYVREAIDKLSKGEKLEVTQTKPYGCGVKYGR